MKKVLMCILALSMLVSLCACGKKNVTKIELGEGLSPWTLSEERYEDALPEDAAQQCLTAVYRTDGDGADIFVYRYPKEDGVSLTDIGQAQADENGVFCNMMTDNGVPCANSVFARDTGLVQTYLYEGEDDFVKVSLEYKSDAVPLGDSGLSILLPKGYSAQENKDSVYPYDVTYTTDCPYLPTVEVRSFGKDLFTSGDFDAEKFDEFDGALFSSLSSDGLTAEEEIELYSQAHDLIKGEMIKRNGYDVAFIGYIENGKFYVRAFVDNGDELLAIGAQAQTAAFRHVVNALIDTIDKR